jgi:hypothetical protein
VKRDDNDTAVVASLPPHHWQLAKSASDIEAYREKYNLTYVSASPQEAALMPGWPQALVQYILIAPPVNIWYGRTESATTSSSNDGVHVTSYTQMKNSMLSPFLLLQIIFSPFIFVAWVVGFALSQHQRQTAGWMSVLGWATWFELMHVAFGKWAIPALVFQWPASLALVAQRWAGGLGDVAYQIDDLNGCTPVDGLAYLQQGARSQSFKIVQAVTFPISTAFLLYSLKEPKNFNQLIALPALAELIYTAVIASQGTPLVVSGNCLLAELNPNKGFLDSEISTRWKVLASFMGF